MNSKPFKDIAIGDRFTLVNQGSRIYLEYTKNSLNTAKVSKEVGSSPSRMMGKVLTFGMFSSVFPVEEREIA